MTTTAALDYLAQWGTVQAERDVFNCDPDVPKDVSALLKLDSEVLRDMIIAHIKKKREVNKEN